MSEYKYDCQNTSHDEHADVETNTRHATCQSHEFLNKLDAAGLKLPQECFLIVIEADCKKGPPVITIKSYVDKPMADAIASVIGQEQYTDQK